MAKIFTPQELFDDGVVPSIDSYKEFKSWVRGRLEKMHSGGLLIGSLFYGSMIQGDFYAGSDLDLLIVYNSKKLGRDSAKKLFGDLEEEGKKLFNIGLSPHPRISDSTTDWRAGELSGNDEEEQKNRGGSPPSCSTGHRFVEYLKTCASSPDSIKENVVGINPISIITGSSSQITRYRQVANESMRAHEMIARMNFVIRRIKEKSSSSANSDGINYELLALRLREPVFAALDLLWFKNGFVPRTSDGRLINKNDLAKEFLKQFPNFPAKELVDSIKLFNDYRSMINELSRLNLVDRAKHRSSYLQLVKMMNQITPTFDNFINRCHDYIMQLTKKEMVVVC